MAESLQELLQQYLPSTTPPTSSDLSAKYLSRLVSLHLSDLTSTEPQSLYQASHSNLVSIQALSSRSHRMTTVSSDHLSTLRESLPVLATSIAEIRDAIPRLDESAVIFASSYSTSKEDNPTLHARKESILLARQADKLQDILELPALLSTAIASAGTATAGGANYSQALDLFAHIKRLQILYPDSSLVTSIVADAEAAMKDMTTNLITSLRAQNIRLAAAIRTIGWLRRVAPELGTSRRWASPPAFGCSSTPAQDEGHFGALFLCARLCTFLTMTEALAPLRDLADQETNQRSHSSHTRTEPVGRSSGTGYIAQGQQTERYLKRYIEIFREQSFATVSMYRNIFPPPEDGEAGSSDLLQMPSALATFPLHLVEIFMDTLRTYLPNVTDPAARESLLMQVLYAANSLGRLGADFSMMIALLNENEIGPTEDPSQGASNGAEEGEKENSAETEQERTPVEPEWARVIKKHRVQAARLEALAAGQDQMVSKRGSADIAFR